MRRTEVMAAGRHAAVGGAAAALASALGGRVSSRTRAAATATVLGALGGAVLWGERSAITHTRRVRGEVRDLTGSLRRLESGLARDLGEIQGLLARVSDRQQDVCREAVTGVEGTVLGQVRASEQRLAHQMDAVWAQAEALMNLYALVRPRSALPTSRNWAASPDLLLTYVGEILASPEGSIVLECGSGTSTVWAAYALDARGGVGRVVALEHDPRFRQRTVEALALHGLAHRAEVRLAPIESVTLARGGQQPWYATAGVADLSDIGVMLVDGPVGSLHERSRYPAMPLLRERLLPGAAVLLDDTGRPDERALVEAWARENPELEVTFLPHEKGTTLLRVPGADQVAG